MMNRRLIQRSQRYLGNYCRICGVLNKLQSYAELRCEICAMEADVHSLNASPHLSVHSKVAKVGNCYNYRN